MTKLKKIDEAANNYNKTNGPHTIERRTLSTSGSDKRDDGWYRVIE